jgi:hypothetical protein
MPKYSTEMTLIIKSIFHGDMSQRVRTARQGLRSGSHTQFIYKFTQGLPHFFHKKLSKVDRMEIDRLCHFRQRQA